MWQGGTATVEEIGTANQRPPLAVGDIVCARAGTWDPDFPDCRLDGWMGEIVEVDETVAPARYLVQWNQRTLGRMSPDCRDRCEMEDFVLDRMWLFDDDLDVLPV
jgi:hypothetical protein